MLHVRSTRRKFLTGAASGFFAFSMRHSLGRAFAATSAGSAKRCLVLWMNGGPSQFETFDPKPGTVTGGRWLRPGCAPACSRACGPAAWRC